MSVLRLSILLSVASVLGCGESVPTKDLAHEIPTDWEMIKADNYFRFRAPSDLQKQDVQGVDSLVGEFVSPTLTLSFDYGAYSDPLDREGFEGFWTTIDGRRARIARNEELIGVHFPDVNGGPKQPMTTKLTMFVKLNGAPPEIGETIFQTIEFGE